MALESYRRQRVISNSANADFDQIIMLNAGDVDGRIVRFEAAKGNGRAATACKLWIDKGEGLAVFCELIRVDMPTPTWEAAVPVKGLAVGTYDAAIRLEDVDGSITETMPLRVQVIGSILAESEATEEMQDALDDFEIRTNAALADIAEAITDAETATENANSATTSANSAAVAANTAAQNIGAVVNDQGILVVTNADGSTTTYSGAATAAQSATSAATRANAAAVSAETAAGNIGAEVDSSGIVTVTDADGTQTEFSGLADAVLLARGAAERAGDAAVLAGLATNSANDAAIAANDAADSANDAASSATDAAETATEAASSATEAAASATDAASTATEAASTATDAATAATDAATSATDAATSASEATTAADTATTNAEAATTAANEAASSAADAAAAASDAAEDATDAATEARDAAAAALASVGNTVLGEISMLDGAIETVDDAYVSPIRGIEVEGKSTQVSIGGNQLWVGDTDISYTRTGYYYDVNTDIKPIVNAPFSVSYDVVSTVEPFNASVGLGIKNGTPYIIDVKSELILQNGHIAITFTVTDSNIQNMTDRGYSVDNIILSFRFVRFSASTEHAVQITHIMLNAGDTALPFEPYVGGIPSPNPDYPQAIHSVAEAGQVITGRCVWGGEKMADDIVAAVGNATYAYKGEDSYGKYVFLQASSASGGKTLFDIFKPSTKYTLILKAKKTNTSTATNLRFTATDGTNFNIDAPTGSFADSATAYTFAVAYPSSKSISKLMTMYASGGTYIYYEQSGLFEGALTTADFAPYLGTATPLIPSGTEPLRSLPNGVRDELIVHSDGSREIVRRVGTAIFDETKSYAHYGSASDPNYDGVSCVISAMMVGNRSSGYCDKAVIATNSSGVYAWLGVNSNLIYLPNILRKLNIEFADFQEWIAENPIMFAFPLAAEVIEPLPSISMPSAPSSDVTAWLDSKDESSAPIATDASVSYERSMQIVIDKLEQAIADL